MDTLDHTPIPLMEGLNYAYEQYKAARANNDFRTASAHRLFIYGLHNAILKKDLMTEREVLEHFHTNLHKEC